MKLLSNQFPAIIINLLCVSSCMDAMDELAFNMIVAIRSYDDFLCTGALITPKFILTTKYCNVQKPLYVYGKGCTIPEDDCKSSRVIRRITYRTAYWYKCSDITIFQIFPLMYQDYAELPRLSLNNKNLTKYFKNCWAVGFAQKTCERQENTFTTKVKLVENVEYCKDRHLLKTKCEIDSCVDANSPKYVYTEVMDYPQWCEGHGGAALFCYTDYGEYFLYGISTHTCEIWSKLDLRMSSFIRVDEKLAWIHETVNRYFDLE